MAAGKHGDPKHSEMALPPMKTGTLTVADSRLSAAFERALGGGPVGPHLPASSYRRERESAQNAKAGKPAFSNKGAPRAAHIGPRSGHK
jgi:hypothetical protein